MVIFLGIQAGFPQIDLKMSQAEILSSRFASGLLLHKNLAETYSPTPPLLLFLMLTSNSLLQAVLCHLCNCLLPCMFYFVLVPTPPVCLFGGWDYSKSNMTKPSSFHRRLQFMSSALGPSGMTVQCREETHWNSWSNDSLVQSLLYENAVGCQHLQGAIA